MSELAAKAYVVTEHQGDAAHIIGVGSTPQAAQRIVEAAADDMGRTIPRRTVDRWTTQTVRVDGVSHPDFDERWTTQ